MKVVKSKKEREENDRRNNILSLNISIGASITLFFTMLKEFLMLFKMQTELLNALFGIATLVLFMAVLKMNLGEKVKNKPNMRSMIDVFTFVAIMIFGLENTVLIVEENSHFRMEGFIVLCVLFALCVYAFYLTFFVRKDRKHKVD